MPENCEHIDSILERSGRDQLQRFNEILDPESLKLHDFEIEDWILFAYNFAKHVNYFNAENQERTGDNWQEFFRYFNYEKDTVPLRGQPEYDTLKEEITKTLQKEEENSEVTPHFTLFVCFLKLIQFSQQRFNSLTKRHLDFYFGKILQVEKLPAVEDKVHLLFEIAKKSAAEKVEENIALDAGKDNEGKKRVYKTDTDLIANKAKVALLKNIYHHQELELDGSDPTIERIVDAEINVADIANSFDGKGEDFPDTSDYWWPFGYRSNEGTFPDLDSAKIGFSFASQLFDLKEGVRSIQITIKLDDPKILTTPGDEPSLELPPQIFEFSDLNKNISIFYTSESGWIELKELKGLKKKVSETDFRTEMVQSDSGVALKLAFQIPQDNPAFIGYDKKLHDGAYTTSLPVIRFIINTKKKKKATVKAGEELYDYTAYHIYRRLSLSTITSVKAAVNVKEIKSLELENDTGVINVKKPFYPFTTNPIKRSNFSINYPEVFSKAWENIDIDITWKDTPINGFVKHYEYYKNGKGSSATAIVTNDNYFKFIPGVYIPNDWDEEGSPMTTLFSQDTSKVYKTIHTFSNVSRKYEPGKSGPVRLSITKSFLQELFPTKYALAISSEITTPSADGVEPPIPKEPYIPLVDKIELSYSATADISGNSIHLFHEDPFGQHQISLVENRPHLIPQHCRGGSLFIGLENAEPNQQISLLIQVLEGSENPLETPFVGKQRVEWDVLAHNQWINIEDNILFNSTDNLLKSGIIRFALPKEVTTTNTRLPAGFTWIRARIHKNYDAVSKIKGIYAQAVVATFDNQNNELSHLEQGLEAETISKLVTRVPQVKTITQPFNSFDGRPEESDAAYYRRISERLRHKNRAITLWDYENLVLQEFPEIYKVKCLNHTNDLSFLSPGDVTLVVIPDTINKNVFDIFQPRVSKATINKVQNYINKLNTKLVTARVTNPLYEAVKVYLSAKFYDQYDVDFYKEQLKEDITKFLSPWAFDVSRTVDFGIILYRSVLIDYLEKLYYVDYLENVSLEKVDQNGDVMPTKEVREAISISPSTPSAILVSAKTHSINTDVKPCKPINIAPREECQI